MSARSDDDWFTERADAAAATIRMQATVDALRLRAKRAELDADRLADLVELARTGRGVSLATVDSVLSNYRINQVLR